jgi:hypothetical protein
VYENSRFYKPKKPPEMCIKRKEGLVYLWAPFINTQDGENFRTHSSVVTGTSLGVSGLDYTPCYTSWPKEVDQVLSVCSMFNRTFYGNF